MLRRVLGCRVHLTNLGRLFLVQLFHWFPSMRRAFAIVQTGDRCSLAWSRLSLLLALEITLSGRTAANQRGAARLFPRISIENPLWGAPRCSSLDLTSPSRALPSSRGVIPSSSARHREEV